MIGDPLLFRVIDRASALAAAARGALARLGGAPSAALLRDAAARGMAHAYETAASRGVAYVFARVDASLETGELVARCAQIADEARARGVPEGEIVANVAAVVAHDEAVALRGFLNTLAKQARESV